MDVTKSNGFYEMTEDEMVEIDGGAFPVLFVIWGIEVTVGHCLAAGAALGLTAGGALILN
ncbi:MAG: class IIb bacteriocin, lactobin A/cerein 7B family [Lachnospira sp.]